jgi:acyl dehydratase
MGTKCPGPGTKVLELTSKFVKPCLVGTEVKVEVNLSEKRKISLATYKVSDVQSEDTVFVQGTARLLLK